MYFQLKWARAALCKSMAIGLTITLFTTNVLLAHLPETSFWAERKKAQESTHSPQYAALPAPSASIFNSRHPGNLLAGINKNRSAVFFRDPGQKIAGMTTLIQYGTIRKVLKPQSSLLRTTNNVGYEGQAKSKIVIHIQDVHMNAEAQENIGKAVQELINEKVVDLVGLEAAFEPMDFSWFRSYPYQDSVKMVANFLRKEKRITGPVYTAFTLRLRSGQALPPFVGVDDKRHYAANVDAYRRSSVLVSKYKKEIEKEIRELAEAKREIFNASLKDFDDHIEAYRKGSITWGDYVRFLAKQTHADVSPKIEAFLAALEMESRLNFAQVESERTRLIVQLVQQLSKTETQTLLDHSAAYRTGAVSHSDFYAFLRELCAKKNLDLRGTPAMDGYIRYVLLSDSLDVEGIIKETVSIEKDLYSVLAKTDEELRLVKTARWIYLTGKLLDFALTKEEWREYKEAVIPAKAGIQVSNNFLKKVDNLDSRFRGNDGLHSFEAFYKEAEARDRAMAENLQKAMDASNAKVAVLVTGGFHSEGLARHLLSQGVTVISYAPKISKIEDENGSSHLSMFTQEKTPLDQLFSGEKLFLGGAPATPLGPTEAVVI